jgi:FkbM family methyltransferase
MTSKEFEIARRMLGASRSLDRRVVGLLKRIPFINRHYVLASYNLLLRKLPKKKHYATTYFGSKMHCTFRDYGQARILHFGFYEPNISALIESILTNGDVFLDIGANIGYHSLLASKLVGADGAVIAIEASPSNFAILLLHIRENHAGNVRIINKAASDAPGSVIIYRGLPGNIGTATTIKSRGYDEEGIVESTPIDHILTWEELSRLRLIKMDIEGGELPVLRRFLQTMDLYPLDINLIVEVSTWEDSRGWSDVFARLRDAGFHAYLIENLYGYDAYSNWKGPAPLRLLEEVPSGINDILFRRGLYRDYPASAPVRQNCQVEEGSDCLIGQAESGCQGVGLAG